MNTQAHIVTIRDLRDHGGDVIDRVLAGERLTVTRSGAPVAALRPIPKQGIDSETLLARWQRLPRVDADAPRAGLDTQLDALI